MKILNTACKFLDVSYFYKLFGSVVKGKEVTVSDFCSIIPKKKESNNTVPIVNDLVPTLNYWRYAKGIDVVFSPLRHVYMCFGEWPVDIETFNNMYPDFNEKDVIHENDKDTES